jgi:hypothetical protein
MADHQSRPRRKMNDLHRPGTSLLEEPPEVRTSHSEKGDTSDDTHGEGGSVTVRVDCEVARLRVKVLGSVVCHCDYYEL